MTDYQDYSKYSDNKPPTPISPDSGGAGVHYPQDYGGKPFPGRETDHAYLVLVLGILSLACCFPLGIVAWIMGNREMSKIAQGRISPKNSAVIQVGRALGIIGVLMTVIFVVAFGVILQKDWIEDPWETFSPKPLAPEHVAYIGHWEGNKGTVIDIKASGRASFKSDNSSVEGGVVKIKDRILSIGLFGINKKWRIRQEPILEDSGWLMQLDDEVFRKISNGKLAMGACQIHL